MGSSEPVEEPHGEKLVQLSEEWSAQLNGALAARSRTPCANSPEFLLFCMKKTTCLLEHAVEQDPHLLTPGRMATYLEVAKEVQAGGSTLPWREQGVGFIVYSVPGMRGMAQAFVFQRSE